MNISRTWRAACSVPLAILGTVGWWRVHPTPLDLKSLPDLISAIFVLCVLVALFFVALPLINRRSLRYALPLGLFFGLCYACGYDIYFRDGIDYSLGGICEKILLIVCFSLVGTAAIIALTCKFPLRKAKRLPLSPIRVFFISWGIMLVCWLPCYVAYFPGIFAYDFPTQIAGISSGMLSADHPLLYSIITWAFLSAGKAIHSYTLGAAAYSLFQMLTLSASFAVSVAYLNKRGVSAPWQALCLGWFALLPIHPLFAINATKDVLFAALTVVFIILTSELLHTPQDKLRRPLFIVGYVLTATAMTLTCKTGIYVLAVFLPFLFFFSRPHRTWALLLGVSCVASFFISQSVLGAVLDVREGRFTEMLSVPLQQVARCANDGVLSYEELEAVEAFIPKEVWSGYSSRLADQVKNNVDREYLRDNIQSFLRLWVKLGIRHPASYADAFFGLNVGFWYPDMQFPDRRTWHEYIETSIKPISEDIGIRDFDLWHEGRSFYEGIAKDARFESLPLISLLFKPGIYFHLTLSLLAAAIFHRRRASCGVLVFLTLSWLVQLLSPISLLRYAYPFMVSIPSVLGSFSENSRWKE